MGPLFSSSVSDCRHQPSPSSTSSLSSSPSQIDLFFNYYPKRVGQVLFVDAPFYFQPGWNMVKPLLKSYASLVTATHSPSSAWLFPFFSVFFFFFFLSVLQVRFVSADEVRNEYFTPDTVPESFKK